MQAIDFIGGEYRNRTGVHGFAIRCVTTPPTRLQGVSRPVVRDANCVCSSFLRRGSQARKHSAE